MNLIHHFAVNVRKYRRERGYSQEYLAELAGLHRTYISAVEREKRNISIDNIGRIAEALGVNAYELLMPVSVDKNTDEPDFNNNQLLKPKNVVGIENRQSRTSSE